MAGGSLQCLRAEQVALEVAGEPPVDLGRVGKVTGVDVALLTDLCSGGVMPIISCIGADAGGGLLNINADEAAAAVAANLRAEKLVMLTDTPGILKDRRDAQTLISTLNPASCRELIQTGVIDQGMIPKVEACLDSLAAGVGKIHIIDGRVRHSLLLEIYTDVGIGTEIR
jgi:acetylglutamate kinase